VAGMLAASSACVLAHCGGGPSVSFDKADASSEADAGPDSTRDSTVDTGIDAEGDVGTASDGANEADALDATVDAPTADAGDAGADAPDGASDASDASDGASDAPYDAPQDSAPEAAPPIHCDTQTPCTDAGAVRCCQGVCVDTSADPANCGQCGNACSAVQFCDGTGCDDAIVANVCDNSRGTVVFDPFAVDNEAGVALGGTLTSYCVKVPTLVQVGQDAGGVIDPVTGRPLTGVGNTFIAGGGSFGQRGINYIELTASISPVYLHTDGTTAQIVVRATTTNVVDTLNADLDAHHDFFYIQLTVEPQSGTLCFSAEGINGPGTQAAGYYVAAVIGPHLSTYTKTWYVVEWKDTNGDSIANFGDMFIPVASGP
jgi:Stigma-specific protein, Stig1